MLTLIVDENIHETSPLMDRFRKTRTGRTEGLVIEYLGRTRPGIPDLEILTKILSERTILLTKDRMLHSQALVMGFRSFYMNEHGEFTNGKLPGVLPKPLPRSAFTELKENYQPRSHPIARQLSSALSEKKCEGYRKTRRRIRSYFASAAAIREISVSVGALETRRGLLSGFSMWFYACTDLAKLRGTEGYALPSSASNDPALPLLFALRDVFFLHMDQTVVRLYISHLRSLELARHLQSTLEPPASPLHQLLHSMLHALPKLSLLPSVKGAPFDAMQKKLKALSSWTSNEVQTLDFDALSQLPEARELLEASQLPEVNRLPDCPF